MAGLILQAPPWLPSVFSMTDTLSPTPPDAVQRVAALLREAGHAEAPRQLPPGSSPADTARALGVALGQIAECAVFRRTADDACVMVVVPADRVLDAHKLAAFAAPGGQALAPADTAFAEARSGQAIGGIGPLAMPTLATPAIVFIDRSLLRFETLWLPCGAPDWFVPLMPQELELLADGVVVDAVAHPDDETGAREEAIRLVLARAATVSTGGDLVPSPCISVCRIHAESQLCEGCFRTLAEISAWGRSSGEAKRALWQTIRQRIAVAQG
jgi:prolyl-tRNA editing enzyme YbaK/EbsC (Cys-tRNA(Pro) deacylase)/predicted Fe-S protein YdhL (DUF1289 family)